MTIEKFIYNNNVPKDIITFFKNKLKEKYLLNPIFSYLDTPKIMKFPVLDDNIGVNCEYCYRKDFFTKIHMGEYISCPLCTDWDENMENKDYHYYRTDIEDFKEAKKIWGDKYKMYDSILEYLEYCKECNILYKSSITHSRQGCSESVYYVKFINKFKYKNKIYNNCMPLFDNWDHVSYLYPLLTDIEWKCTSNNREIDCPRNQY